jgi:pyruvate/2-oxoglutarate dehydrogenase complex dihydrolipoamide dehydrogenase (E3) component
MTNLLQCDLCILGGGGAGLAAARTAAQLGAKVVVVEKRALGGAYLTQMVPVQAFCTAALQAGAARNACVSGMPKIDFVRLRADVLAAMKDFAHDYTPGPLTALNIEIIRSLGSFSRPTRLEAGGRSIEAKHFILATGSMPAPTALPGQELIRPLLLEDLLTIDRPPESMIIVGATFQGLVLAQAFLRLGTQVTLIEPGAILPNEDAELLAPVLTQLAREGLQLFSHAEIGGLEPMPGGVRLHLKRQGAPIEAAQIMFAGHPLPLVEGLGLKNARVTYANSGILTDAQGRTSNGHIYAVGDAAGGSDSGLSALGQAERVARRLCGQGRSTAPVARVLGTDPELAMIGLSEAAARGKYRTIHVLRASFADTARARLAGRLDGHVKIVTNAAGTVLGAGLVGPNARELIGIFGVAIERRLNAADLEAIANAPTFAQAASNAALASPPQVGKALRWRRFLPHL